MRPNPHIALIYHYDLARALAGEVVDWQAIPVNVQAGREGGDLCRAAADFAKRRDLFAMPAPSSAVPVGPNPVVEQQAADPEPSTASTAVPGLAVDLDPLREHISVGTIAEPFAMVNGYPDRTKLRLRIMELVDQGHEQLIRRYWPEGVPTLKHDDHSDAQLQLILNCVRRVEAEVGAGWHPDDSPGLHARQAIERALKAWEGRDVGTAWFAASLIATFEQCRNADATLEELVAQFTIEQADRLYDAAQAATQTK